MQKIPFSEALSHVRMVPPSFTVRRVNLIDAVGHVLAEPIYAGYNVPPAPVSAMDGFAVSAKETETASETHPLTLTQFDRVNTGEVVRPQFDAVIMVEDTEFTGEQPSEITIRSPIKAGRNVRLTAEDIRKGGLVLPAGAKLRSFDIGAVAGYGITEVAVRSVSVGVIPTGTELIEPGIEPKPGEVVESNTVMTEAYLREFGVDVIRYPPVADDPKAIRAALEKAVSENDLVLLSAGSSMGSHDYTSSVIEDMGRIIFHGVFMKPAKPSMLGSISGKPVIGMPGYPLSAQTTLRMFVRELLEGWGFKGPQTPKVVVEAGAVIPSDAALDEFQFAAVGSVSGKLVALPQIRSSSMQMNGIRANAYLSIPRGAAEIPAGQKVEATLNVPLEDLERTLLLGGVCTEGAEKLTAAAARYGYFIRFGNAGAAELQKGLCHGVISDSADDGFVSVPLEDGSYLLMNKPSDPQMILLKAFAEGDLNAA